MRRWFAILLLAVLPLQFSWAAVAAHCGHGSDVQAQHLAHQQHAQADQPGADEGGGPAAADGSAAVDCECGPCHTNCCSMPAPAGTMTPLAVATHPVASVEGKARTVAQTPPERPQWVRLA
jgi:hypothetical protein